MANRGLRDVLASVPEGWGIVAYSSHMSGGTRRYIAFACRPGGEPTAIAIGPAARVDALVRQWRQELLSDRSGTGAAAARSEKASRKSGRTLRSVIWDPVKAILGDAVGVLVVPDGALHAVSLDALPRDGGGYLVEDDLLIHYAASEKDIVGGFATGVHGTGLLAFGGVDFGPVRPREAKASGAPVEDTPSDDCAGFYGADFHPLPQSRVEVAEIARAWGDSAASTVVVGAEATESAFKRLAPGKRVIHLATHGFFLDPRDCFPGVAGTRGIGGLESGVRPRRKPAFYKQSPLHLSGLALAAANRRSKSTPEQDDGILTAEEVASMDLRGVEWAVLSACDTGVGVDAAGEGILGLRRAFQTAGVGTLVISLWPVEDRAALEWMRALYRMKFHEGVGTAEAVRGAMLEVLRSRRAQGRSTNPSFWAAFLAAGDWN
ncbi:MAG TPA: CHAT domain-containing protein [Candidatus Eisenbacteria bacterium]|nr:CHAT domain-containing protein [Candidatus Eisenbacteria bacterium]